MWNGNVVPWFVKVSFTGSILNERDKFHHHMRMRDGIAVVTINNPPVNALSSQVIDEPEMVVYELARDSVVHSVVSTGEGNKAFVAGADIQLYQNVINSRP